jgi:hypothetical protein
MAKNNPLYTTVTLSDFKDTKYINTLINLNIGMELALLTEEIFALKQEINGFKDAFERFNIPLNKVRIHQPGGYAYYWFKQNTISGFDILKEFFSYCLTLGFEHYTIHAPYGNSIVDKNKELVEYKAKLQNLVPNANLEVEEIMASNYELTNIENIRFYVGDSLEQLLHETQANILLDTYECGGIRKTIQRLEQLASHGFEVKSIHLHKNKHQFLTKNEIHELLATKYSGNLINEGFISRDSSFEKFIKTKSTDCTVPNEEKIKILKSYIK